jgi:predicted TPR repeat methyltransferase
MSAESPGQSIETRTLTMLEWLKKLSRSKPGAPAAAATAGHSAAGSDEGPGYGRSAALTRQGDVHLSERKLGDAAACYRRAVAIDPGSTDAHVKLAATLIQQSQFGDAEAPLRRAISLDPQRADSYYYLGTALIAQGRADDGIRQFDQALQLKPDFEAVFRELCLARFRSGRVEDAKRVAAAGLAACPDSAELHFYRGNLHNHEGDLESAVTCYRKALSLRPDFPEAHLNLGRIFTKQGRPGDALAEFLAVRAVHPDSVDAHVAIGDVMHVQDRLDEAAASFRKAVALAPENAMANERLGWVLQKQRKFAEALACFANAMAIAPDNADIHTGMGLGLEGLGRRDEAIGHFRRALALRPDHINARLSLGNAMLNQGLREQALACYREVIRMQPDHTIGHLVAALSGTNTERAPGTYVESLFDDFAERFDSDLVDALKYSVPQQLADVIGRSASPATRDQDVLDLGCGTGLVGAAVAPHARNLVGVDLSANMLAKARARGLYHRLDQSDLLTMVRNEKPASYDLVLAADVFVYLGRLDELVSEVRRILRPDGLFGLSVEALLPDSGQEASPDDPADYLLRPSGRYAHSLAYLSRLAAVNRFGVLQALPIPVRLEHAKPIPGYLVLLGRLADSTTD